MWHLVMGHKLIGGGWVCGREGVGGKLEPGAGLNLPLGPFGLAMGPRSASHRPKHA